MLLIDSHCHLNYDYDGKTAADLVREAHDEGVGFLVSIGVDLETLAAVVAVSEQFETVFHTVGVHPHEAEKTVALGREAVVAALTAGAQHSKCVAIGELGLDYYYEHSTREAQQVLLQWQLDLALECGKPIVVHGREAEADLQRMLTAHAEKWAVKWGNPREAGGKPIGVIHCFTSSEAFGQACIELGFYISFSGILTFKKADDLRLACLHFPLERMLVETDSPYLAPVPFRGKKGEPRMVKQTALKVAEIKGVSFDEVARITSENTQHLFNLPHFGP